MSFGRGDSRDTAGKHRPKGTSGPLPCGKACPWQPLFVWGEVLFLLGHQCSREQRSEKFPQHLQQSLNTGHRRSKQVQLLFSRGGGRGARLQRIPNLKTFLMGSRGGNNIRQKIRPELRSSRGFFKKIILVGLSRNFFFPSLRFGCVCMSLYTLIYLCICMWKPGLPSFLLFYLLIWGLPLDLQITILARLAGY